MGSRSRYRCLNCGNEFTADAGGGFCFIEYRCLDCDNIKIVKCRSRTVPVGKWIPPESEEIGSCLKCGGELSEDIPLMCQNCKSRKIECIETLRYCD